MNKWKSRKLKRSYLRNFHRFADERASDIISKFVDEKRELTEPQAKTVAYAIAKIKEPIFKQAIEVSKLAIQPPPEKEDDVTPRINFWDTKFSR